MTTADPPPTEAVKRRANVVGLGLIGGSLSLALRRQGWHVSGDDEREPTLASAVERDIIDAAGLDPEAEITFVAVPVSSIADQVKRVLAETTGIVTDVGSVKASVCRTIVDHRFIGGHPMSGSEFDGLDGAQATLFESAVWVLTPIETADDDAFARLNSIVSSLGADVVALTPEDHDRLVAMVSHVPHLTAATLMQMASTRSEEHAALLRLAAGGFRDMTRVASGRPDIWLDICHENRDAIVDTLSDLIDRLLDMRDVVEHGQRDQLRQRLDAARTARRNLPSRAAQPDDLAEVRIPIPDRTGAAAEVFTLAAELGVNIANFEVVHVAESTRGVAVVIIDRSMSEMFRGGLIARGFRPAVQPLS